MWPEYAKEIQRWFVEVLDDDEAASLQEMLERVDAAAQRELAPGHARSQIQTAS
jgi:hypothetical protein